MRRVPLLTPSLTLLNVQPASARGIGIRVIHKWNQIPRKRPVIVQRYSVFLNIPVVFLLHTCISTKYCSKDRYMYTVVSVQL